MTWVPRCRRGQVVGATTYVSYVDDDEDAGAPWVGVESDGWDTPELGELDDVPMEEVDDLAKAAVWFRSRVVDRFLLPDFSFPNLRALGCTDSAVLVLARAFDADSN